MSAPLNKRLLLSLGSVCVFFTPVAAAREPPTPLLQTLEKLACAADPKTAQQKLDTLFNISPPGQDWPDEWLGQQAEHAMLYAGTLDITLHTLQATAKRFPELRETTERIVLQWNYCDILEEKQFYDLSLQRAELKKVLADNDVPLKWEGFRQWGFLTPDPAERFVPKLLDDISLAPTAYHLFLHRAYRQHCFPHPETGLRVNEAEAPRETVASPAFPLLIGENLKPQMYPFGWNPVCHITPNETTKKRAKETVPKITTLEKAKTQVATKTGDAGKIKIRKAKAVTAKSDKKTQQTVTPTANKPQTAEVDVTVASVANVVTPPPATSHTQTKTDAKDNQGERQASTKPAKQEQREKGQVVLPAIVPTTAGGDIPLFIEEESATQAHSTTGIIDTKKKKLRLAGSFADTLSLKDGSNSLSASATWSPKPNWFVNGNVSIKDGKPGYAWSAGYADNKPGGWSAQVNNFGPIQPGKGLEMDKAIVNIGHKIKSDKLTKHKLAASTNISIPTKGKPGISGTLQWNPKPNWYARTTVSVPLEGGKPNWNYAAGYAPPKPGKWRVEYANYGTNQFPGDNLKEGAITVSRGWQF